MIINMGPHHLSMHGVFRLIVTLDGEDIVDCELILSYLHREMKKIAKNRTIISYLSYSNYVGVESYSFSSIMVWIFFYIFKERELVNDLFEAVTERIEGIGIIGGEEAINWGLPDPILRASGIKLDLRNFDHYECYDKFDWEIQWQKERDSLACYLARISEMTKSIKMIQQALERIPKSPYENLEIQCFD
ncbi:hypothetical protein ERO13_D09G085250v2 [Gossypium hirsutum]|nr:hypothetical protein ERO13_D09G085250v2 [Gossypium hirsutum]